MQLSVSVSSPAADFASVLTALVKEFDSGETTRHTLMEKTVKEEHPWAIDKAFALSKGVNPVAVIVNIGSLELQELPFGGGVGFGLFCCL